MTRTKQLDGQLTLFPDKKRITKQRKRGAPSWDDVQKGRAIVTHHERYSQPCKPECMWADSIGDFGGHENCCYLFHKPVVDGMCPGTCELEWV